MIPTGYVVDSRHAHDHIVRLVERGYKVWVADRGQSVQLLARPHLLGVRVEAVNPAEWRMADIATSVLHFLDGPQVERVYVP